MAFISPDNSPAERKILFDIASEYGAPFRVTSRESDLPGAEYSMPSEDDPNQTPIGTLCVGELSVVKLYDNESEHNDVGDDVEAFGVTLSMADGEQTMLYPRDIETVSIDHHCSDVLPLYHEEIPPLAVQESVVGVHSYALAMGLRQIVTGIQIDDESRLYTLRFISDGVMKGGEMDILMTGCDPGSIVVTSSLPGTVGETFIVPDFAEEVPILINNFGEGAPFEQLELAHNEALANQRNARLSPFVGDLAIIRMTQHVHASNL